MKFVVKTLVAAALTMAALVAGIAVYGLVDREDPADVAVVLGNEVHADGTPAPRLAARLDRAIRLYREGRCPLVIVSGGVGKSGADEATAMGRYLIRHGVPPEAIVHDHHGVNTMATARFTAAFLRERGLRSAIAVSQYFHIPRCAIFFAHQGVAEIGTASPKYFELSDVHSLCRELAALGWHYVSMPFTYGLGRGG